MRLPFSRSGLSRCKGSIIVLLSLWFDRGGGQSVSHSTNQSNKH